MQIPLVFTENSLRLGKKTRKRPSFCTFLTSHIREFPFCHRLHSPRIVLRMDAIDLAIRLSFTYIYLLCACSHRCASHLDRDVLLQVLDVPWPGNIRMFFLGAVWGCRGVGGVGGGVGGWVGGGVGGRVSGGWVFLGGV